MIENKKFSRNKISLITGAVIAFCGIIIVIVLMLRGNATDKRLAKQLDLGNSYMDELNYEQAIVAFEEAIKIDPKSEEAYICLANVYIEQGEYAKAIEVLEEGYVQTESAEIQRMEEEVALAMEEITQNVENAENATETYAEPTGIGMEETSGENHTERTDYDDGSYSVREYDADETKVITEVPDTSIKNVPVGINPMVDMDVREGSEEYYIYTYIFTDGSQIACTGGNYVGDTIDIDGVTYREYRQGANEIVMQMVADYIAQYPDSNFASLIQQYGNQVVIVSSSGGLWDDQYDYYSYFNIVECQPDDCCYMFIAGVAFEEDYIKETCDMLFSNVSDNIIVK